MLLETGKYWDDTPLQESFKPKMGTFLLSEDYYGKNKLLLEIETLVAKLKKKIVENPYKVVSAYEENIKIEKLFGKLFNVERFNIEWIPTNSVSNGSTLPLSLLLFEKYSDFDVVSNKSGVRFKNPKGKTIMVDSYNSLFTLLDCSPAEWVAIILHEIGHNFYVGAYKYGANKLRLIYIILNNIIGMLGKINPFLIPIFILQFADLFFVTTRTGRKVDIIVTDYIRNNKVLNKINTVAMGFTGLLVDMINIFSQIQNSVFVVTGAWVISLPRLAMLSGRLFVDSLIFDSYQDEKFADNFATSYGYGLEISSTMKKFEGTKHSSMVEKSIQNIPIYSHLYNANNFIINSIVGIGECHPDNYQRVADQAKMLKQELNKKGIDPKVRKIMQKDLDEIEELYESMYSNEYIKENNTHFEGLVNKILRSLGGERRDVKDFILPTKDYNHPELRPQSER